MLDRAKRHHAVDFGAAPICPLVQVMWFAEPHLPIAAWRGTFRVASAQGTSLRLAGQAVRSPEIQRSALPVDAQHADRAIAHQALCRFSADRPRALQAGGASVGLHDHGQVRLAPGPAGQAAGVQLAPAKQHQRVGLALLLCAVVAFGRHTDQRVQGDPERRSAFRRQGAIDADHAIGQVVQVQPPLALLLHGEPGHAFGVDTVPDLPGRLPELGRVLGLRRLQQLVLGSQAQVIGGARDLQRVLDADLT